MRRALASLSFVAAVCAGAPIPGLPVAGANVLKVETPRPAPGWAVLERDLIEASNRAAVAFVKTYTNPDGTLRFMERYEGGMNSSDDAYEAFRGFSQHYILGGSKELDRLHRWAWEGITRQFTRYGNIYREFDSNWDWMHHGEGYTSFYTFGLADPLDGKFRERSRRFAAMYIGEDPESPNYDSDINIIRAVMTGSRGPKMTWNRRDWIPTNANLVYYHLPFPDIPGVKTSTGWINDEAFEIIVKTMSDRMARGDVPINLTATPLMADAYMYSGNEKYRRWVVKYVQGWIDRTKQNHGITPDNVGLTGKIGEYMNGKWWGGYYGWYWPRGGADIVKAASTGAKTALLLTGDVKWLDFPRTQLEVIRKNGKLENGHLLVPARYGDAGWHMFAPETIAPYVALWAVSQDARDWSEIERIAAAQRTAMPAGRRSGGDLGWVNFLAGRNPEYPELVLKDDLEFVRRQMQDILNEHGDPDTFVDNKWSSANPLPMDSLVRLTTGALPVDIRGELLYAAVRYFDADRREPGLPEGVAALVSRLARSKAEVQLVNTNLFERRRVIVQGGAYGEHQITQVRAEGQPANIVVNQRWFEVDLAPGAGTTLHIGIERFANRPSYRFPWQQEAR